jgi:hypothetical protein
MCPVGLFLSARLPKPENNHSFPPNVEVNIKWSCISTSPFLRIGGYLYSDIIDGVKQHVYRYKKRPHKESLSSLYSIFQYKYRISSLNISFRLLDDKTKGPASMRSQWPIAYVSPHDGLT